MIAVHHLGRRYPDLDASGKAGFDNWTAITDVGQSFQGSRLELSEFIDTENAMVEEVQGILKANDVSRLAVLWDGWLDEPFIEEEARLVGLERDKIVDHKKGDWLDPDEIGMAVRLILREVGGTAMTDYENFYLRPVQDFEVQIGTVNVDTMRNYETKSGLLFLSNLHDVPTQGELWEEEYKQFFPKLSE